MSAGMPTDRRSFTLALLMIFAVGIAVSFAGAPSAALAIENGGYVNPQLLVSTEWLAQHMNDPGVKILDRQDIDPPDDIYSKGHIPNSIRMSTSAIKGMKGDIKEMLILMDLVAFLSANGVTASDHIILAGSAGRLPATSRVFWALEILGHQQASILDGGIDKWKAEQRPLSTEPPKVAAATYKPAGLDRERFMAGDELLGYLGLFDEWA
jgi:thiosulfate/3-mercaptopyruvate sulfurtransferase